MSSDSVTHLVATIRRELKEREQIVSLEEQEVQIVMGTDIVHLHILMPQIQ